MVKEGNNANLGEVRSRSFSIFNPRIHHSQLTYPYRCEKVVMLLDRSLLNFIFLFSLRRRLALQQIHIVQYVRLHPMWYGYLQVQICHTWLLFSPREMDSLFCIMKPPVHKVPECRCTTYETTYGTIST